MFPSRTTECSSIALESTESIQSACETRFSQGNWIPIDDTERTALEEADQTKRDAKCSQSRSELTPLQEMPSTELTLRWSRKHVVQTVCVQSVITALSVALLRRRGRRRAYVGMLDGRLARRSLISLRARSSICLARSNPYLSNRSSARSSASFSKLISIQAGDTGAPSKSLSAFGRVGLKRRVTRKAIIFFERC